VLEPRSARQRGREAQSDAMPDRQRLPNPTGSNSPHQAADDHAGDATVW